jgi:hypothetical protein
MADTERTGRVGIVRLARLVLPGPGAAGVP